MEGKIRTTLYLSRDAKRLVDDEVINFSQWVEDKVFTSLSCENIESVLEKKKELLAKVKTLDLRISELESRKSSKLVDDSLFDLALEELRSSFSIRMQTERSRNENIAWILAPKNVGRCKIIGKTPEQMLDLLEVWYDGEKKVGHA